MVNGNVVNDYFSLDIALIMALLRVLGTGISICCEFLSFVDVSFVLVSLGLPNSLATTNAFCRKIYHSPKIHTQSLLLAVIMFIHL